MAATSPIQKIVIGPLRPIHLQRNIMHNHCQISKNLGERCFILLKMYSPKNMQMIL